VTPAGYRTAVLSDSPQGCSLCLRGGRDSGNDPDAKPACGTPRAGRRAAAVVPSAENSFGEHRSVAGRPSHVKRGPRPLGRGPEAPTGVSHFKGAQRPRGNQYQQKMYISRGRNLSEANFYLIEASTKIARSLCLLPMPTVTTPVGIGVGTPCRHRLSLRRRPEIC
jgi:hypothetical protein